MWYHYSPCARSATLRAFLILLLLGVARLAWAQPASAQIYLDALVDFERHAETIWHNANGVYPNAPTDAGYWGDGQNSGNGGIRGNCGVALAYAVLVKAYPAAGNRALRLERVRQALQYAANTHVSGTNRTVNGGTWGHSWQSALWGGSMGLACALVQDQLPAATVSLVKAAVADEASYRAGVPPASGYIGDTKAEENGWDSNILALAAAWMSAHTNAPLWLEATKTYLANTYTVPDKTGDPLAEWISTITLYPDFSLENHGFYHPTYQMVAGMSMGDSLLMAQLANPAVAQELQPFAEHNVLNVWSHLQHLVLDSGEFAYPSGLDWELHDFEHNSYLAWLAAHFNDPVARYADGQLAPAVRYRQLVNQDGRFVGESLSNGFFREAVEARRTAIAYLHWMNAAHPNGPAAAPGPDFNHSPGVRIISQRSPAGFFSLSYGPKIMGLVEPAALNPPTNAFTTTPRQPGLIGLGALGDPTAARLVSLVTNSLGFEAHLELTNGGNGITHVFVNCTGESLGMIEWPAAQIEPGATQAGSFIQGIENDPLTGRRRRLDWTGGFQYFTNRTGAGRNITNNWVCVDDRLGVAAGPAGYFAYKAASSYNRPGAAQDTLQFITRDQLAPRYAVWFPTQSALAMAAKAAAVTWSVEGTQARLTFPGPGGSNATVTASMASVVPPYPASVLALASVKASSAQTSYPATNAFNGNLTDFWVSSGTAAGQGPTTNKPAWLKAEFIRPSAVSETQIFPRTLNGGYGPKDIKLLLNNVVVYEGRMEPTSTFSLRFPRPIHATNAQLTILSSYDPNYPTNARNVQVVEMRFLERARPGTYGDWALATLGVTYPDDPFAPAGASDPDGDGVNNLGEFVAGGDPSIPDAASAALDLQLPTLNSPTLTLRYRERKDLGNVQTALEVSPNLTNWAPTTPLQITSQDLGLVWLRSATLPLSQEPRFWRRVYTEIY